MTASACCGAGCLSRCSNDSPARALAGSVTARTGSESDGVIARTRRWLSDVVIGLGLCPFAAAPYRAERIRYRVVEEADADAVYRGFLLALQELVDDGGRRWDTGLVITPTALADFDDYLDMLAVLEDALVDAGLEGEFQVASFHPHYRFEGAAADDPANATNRSPYPLFHLIREAQLAEVLAGFPDPDAIPVRNMARLRAMDPAELRRLGLLARGPGDGDDA
jgi:uncharacterized protein